MEPAGAGRVVCGPWRWVIAPPAQGRWWRKRGRLAPCQCLLVIAPRGQAAWRRKRAGNSGPPLRRLRQDVPTACNAGTILDDESGIRIGAGGGRLRIRPSTPPPHYPISSPLPSLLFPLPFLRSLVVTPSSLPLHSSFIIFFAFPITPPPTVETVGYPQPSLRDCPSSPQAAPPPPPRVP